MVSIITPVYNVKEYIVETMESVRRQTLTDWELILVDDGSTDGSKELILDYIEKKQDQRIRLVELEQNMGAATARNYGVERAQGRYIAFLDSDDIWMEDKLEKQVEWMEKQGSAFSFTGYEFANHAGEPTGKVVRVPETITYKEALKNTTIFTSTVMFDTIKIAKEKIRMPKIKSEDTALWWTMLKEVGVAHGLGECKVIYRRVEGSLSANKLEALRRIWNLYRSHERLGLLQSMYYFCFWAVTAVKRRV